MTQLLDKIKNDNAFAVDLQAKASVIQSGNASDADREAFLELLADTPEQLEQLKNLNLGDPTVASITITTITTLTTATTAF